MGQTGRRRVDCSRALGRQQQMSDIPSLLRAGVQPTLDPSAETFMSDNVPAQGEEGNL